MVAGLPGTGIGGIFYLLTSLFIPFIEFYKMILGKGDKRRWGFVLFQLLITGGIFLGFWMTGWFLGWLINHSVPAHVLNSKHFLSGNILRGRPFFISILTLSAVLLSVHVLSFWIWIELRFKHSFHRMSRVFSKRMNVVAINFRSYYLKFVLEISKLELKKSIDRIK